MKNNFLKEQAEIRQAEIELHNKTQKLLFNILKSLKNEDLEKISGHILNDNEVILNITEFNDIFYLSLQDFKNYFDRRVDLDDLTQEEQKSLIDIILENNLVSN